MSMDQLMALVPIEAVNSISEKGRKSRWEKAKERKGGSRWGHVDDKPYLPPPYVDLPPGLTPAQMDQFLREQRFDELSRKLLLADIEMDDPDIRPPSPPPIYDKNGSRINTRDIRARNAMVAEHQRLVEYMIKHVDGFSPPADFRPIKKIRRIEIPLEKYPEYNFMGLIIGPRGCNHKRLETESGAQISIRGKGTQKEGKKTDHQTDEEATLPMHVHIAADSEECVEKAVSLIEPLLDPIHPMHEEFKKRGLEQLALVNGVSFGQLDQMRCAVCGAIGHLAHECPDAQQVQNFKKPEIRCAICGDMGHVTMDCKFFNGQNININFGIPNSPPPPPPNGPFAQTIGQQINEKMKIDSEYKRMMITLTGDSSKLDGENSNNLSPSISTTNTNQSQIDNTIGTPPPGISPSIPGVNPLNSFIPGIGISPMNQLSTDDHSFTDSLRNNDINSQGAQFLPRGMINMRPGIGFPDRAALNRIRPATPMRGGLPIRARFPMTPQDQMYVNPVYIGGPIPSQVPLLLQPQPSNQNIPQIHGPILAQIPNTIPGQIPGPIYGQFPSQLPPNGFIPTIPQLSLAQPRPTIIQNIGGDFQLNPAMMFQAQQSNNDSNKPPLPFDIPPNPPNEFFSLLNKYNTSLAGMQIPAMNGSGDNNTLTGIPTMNNINISQNTPQVSNNNSNKNELNDIKVSTSPNNDAMDLSN